MAILKICAIRDRAIDAFMQPFFASASGGAIRAFQDAVNDGSTPMSKHPDDYDLFLIGEFDDNTGQVSAVAVEQLAIGKNMVKQGA